MATVGKQRSDVSSRKVKVKLTDATDVPAKYAGTVVNRWEHGKEYYKKDNFDSLIRAFKDYVYICSSKNAAAFAKGTFRLYVAASVRQKLVVPTKDINNFTLKWLQSDPALQCYLQKAQTIKEVIMHPFLQLLKTPNPFQSTYDLMEMTDLFLELTGNAYWYIYRNKLGIPSQIWIIPPQYVTVIPSRDSFIAGYVFNRNSESVPFSTDELIHFKFPNPHNLYYGMSPHASIINELNTKENMDKFDNALYTNNCRMEGVLETEFELSDATYNRLQERWKQNYSGVNKAGKTAILEKGLKYKSITVAPKDLNNLQGRKNYREIVAGVYGVPMTMLTPEGSSLANSYVSDRQYYSNTIHPRYKRVEGVINTRLLPHFDASLFMVFDNPVPDDLDFRLRERVAYVKAGIRTRNEIRALDGLEPHPEGDTLEIGNSGFINRGAPVGNTNASAIAE